MNDIILKNTNEIELMRESGAILADVMSKLLKAAQVGVTTGELNTLSERLVAEHNVKPSFKGFEGYPFSLVACVNEEVVHGMPSDRKLVEGDLLTLDFGVIKDEFHSDMARSKIVGIASREQMRFLSIGRQALANAVSKCEVSRRIGDISQAIQSTVEKAGYQVVRAFVGHGIGRALHEEPQISGFGRSGTGEVLEAGMVLAVEVMYTMGSYEIEILEDGWTAITADGSLSSMFEDTVAVTTRGPEILTRVALS